MLMHTRIRRLQCGCAYALIAVMSELQFIRTQVLQVSQREMAAIAGVDQATVSRWEQRGFEPTREAMKRIRQEAKQRGIEWNDLWFFEAPEARAS